MRLLLLFFVSFFTFADDHKMSSDFSDCEGKIANYYVAKINKGGTVEGWLEASKMHQKFYKDRGSDIMIIPMMQYKRDDDGNTIDELYRVSTMVVGSQDSWSKWRDIRNNQTDAEAKTSQAEYDAYVALYDKHNTLTAQRRVCIL